tara:strand:- start:328 stop:1038 length:711 start_codon:yes stop_codon:yes gene_type:complete
MNKSKKLNLSKSEEKIKNKVKNFYNKWDTRKVNYVPNETIFRLLSNYKFNFKGKNCLDIGIGNGDNLLECKKRGAKIFGIDIKKNLINQIIKKNKQNKNNFFVCDLNDSFPNIKTSIDFCFIKDTIYYLTDESKLKLFEEIYGILKKNGYFLFQYIQAQLKVKYKNKFLYNLDNKLLANYAFPDKKNPVKYLKDDKINKLITSQKFKFVDSVFDISTHLVKKDKIIRINRYFLLKK